MQFFLNENPAIKVHVTNARFVIIGINIKVFLWDEQRKFY